MIMTKNGFVLFFILMVLFGGFSSSTAAPPPAKIVSGVFSNTLSFLLKWLWSLKASTKTAISGRPMMKFEGGYTVETVFDGSKLGIEPYSIEVSPSGELLVLDSANSNVYRISQPLSRYSRPKLVAGSPDGYAGHVDGRPREARMNRPKGITVDDKGNIYIADTMNMAIRKISDTGVTTIAGGGSTRGGHVDGPSEDAKFSTDFDVVYIGSSCSLLVIDRGNQAIREIQLHFEDCADQYGAGFPLGIVVLVAAGFFGYMLAMLQRRVGTMVTTQDELGAKKERFPVSPYQKPLKSSVRPPLIPNEGEQERLEESLFGSLGKLFLNAGVSVAEIAGGLFNFKKKPLINHQYQQQYQQQQPKRPNSWPLQESFEIPDSDEPPPSIETRTPTPKKTYAFMSKNPEKTHHYRPSRAVKFNGWGDSDQQQQVPQQQQQQQQQQHQHQQHHNMHYSSGPQTYYEESHETNNEIVFGAVQESEQLEAVVMKPVDYGAPVYNHYNVRSRYNYNGYTHDYQ